VIARPRRSVALVATFLALTGVVALERLGVTSIIRFDRERIEVTVRPDRIEVSGVYVYANPLPIPWTRSMKTPFFTDEGQEAPVAVEVTELDPQTGRECGSLPVCWLLGEPRFTVRVPAHGETHVRVRFAQRVTHERATYLLTTTRPWGRPLTRGEYVVDPRSVCITESSYPLDGADGLSFVKESFMPEKDWTLRWTRAGS
jgi:hypothetical protein